MKRTMRSPHVRIVMDDINSKRMPRELHHLELYAATGARGDIISVPLTEDEALQLANDILKAVVTQRSWRK